MAMVSGILASSMRSGYTNNKPIILGKNLLELTTDESPKWASGGTSAFSVHPSAPSAYGSITNVANSSYPTPRIYDRMAHLPTRPTETIGAAGYYLAFKVSNGSDTSASDYTADLGGNYSNSLDSIIIKPNNFDAISNDGVFVEVYVAEQANWSDATLLAWWLTSDNKPLVEFNLPSAGTTLRLYHYWRNFNYAYIVVYPRNSSNYTSGTTFASGKVPEINEVFFGSRLQLSRNADVPWDDFGFESNYSEFDALSGAAVRYVQNSGGQVFNNDFKPASTSNFQNATTVDTDQYGLNDTKTLQSLWLHTNYGAKNLYYSSKPFGGNPGCLDNSGSSALAGSLTNMRNGGHVATYLTRIDDTNYGMPLGGPFDREVSVTFKEIAPFLSKSYTSYLY